MKTGTSTVGLSIISDSQNPTPAAHENMGMHFDWTAKTVELLFMSPDRKVVVSMAEFFGAIERVK